MTVSSRARSGARGEEPEAPARTQTAKAVIRLRELIVSGSLAPGERITEVEIARRIEVSRTPVRAALQALRDEGLLERRTPGRYFVRSFSPREIAEAIELRGTLEGLNARLAAERGVAPEHLEALVRIADDLDGLLAGAGEVDLVAYGALNSGFHATLLRTSGSSLLADEVARVSARPFAGASALVHGPQDPERMRAHLRVGQDQHRAIIEALAAREGARVEALLHEHARLARRNLATLHHCVEP
jgi:GntR family transcriptional regulator of vanillate catabolism